MRPKFPYFGDLKVGPERGPKGDFLADTPHSRALPVSPPLKKDDLRPEPIRGGSKPGEPVKPVRLVKNFFSQVVDQDRLTFTDWLVQDNYVTTLNVEQVLQTYNVGEARFLYLDNVEFYAISLITGTLIPAGQIEGFVEPVLKIGERIPMDIRVERRNINNTVGSYFPFLNDRVGPTEVNWNLIARSGESVRVSYTTVALPPVPISIFGARLRGWLGDDIIIKEILEQQR